MATQATPKTIKLKPELTLLASLAHHSMINLLPPVFYEPESVASSVKIGEGVTFTVTRKKVIQPPRLESRPVERDKVTVTASTHHLQPKLPAYIVYKIPEIRFGPTGHAVTDGAHERNLASVLLEFFALKHLPIRLHPFLPSLLGFAWGQNKYILGQRVPIPVVDYAEYGNLAAFQASHQLNFDQKRKVCWQIGTALAFLHECGICHGDVKSENVLLYPTADQTAYKAKLTDFGQSRLSQEGAFKFFPPGTRLWAAPEIRNGQFSGALDKADTFSFGLLTWRIFCDGMDPLCTFFADTDVKMPQNIPELRQQFNLTSRIDDAAYDRLLANDGLKRLAISMRWYFKTLMKEALCEDPRRRMQPVNLISQLKSLHHMIKDSDLDLAWLLKVFDKTLSRLTEERQLSDALQALGEGQTYQRPQIQATQLSPKTDHRFRAAADNTNPVSWLAMRGLHPQVCDFVISHILYRSTLEAYATNDLLYMGNASCLISGMGSDKYQDAERGLEAINAAARLDNREADALIFRMHAAFGREPPEDIDYVNKMHNAAIYGSVAAYEDLKIVAGELAPSIRASLLQQTCGVGANFFWDWQCLNGWKFSDRDQLGWIDGVLQSSSQPNSIIVNQRGDGFLHAAASLNIEYLIPKLLGEYRFNVNQRNSEGETALLCAMRAGAFSIAHQLLDNGADPSIISNRSESPLHWMISITEFGYKSMIAKIIEKGGLQTIKCWAQMCDYAAVGMPSFHQYSERLSNGTPLHWAICRKKAFLIRQLLDNGAPTDFTGPSDDFYTPFEQAAYLHEAALLRLLIDMRAPHPRQPSFPGPRRGNITKLGPDGKVPQGKTILHGVPEMVKAAIDGSDRFSLLVRHGDRYKSQMRRTFQLLGKEMEYTTFTLGVDGEGRTSLHYAAMHGFDEAVDCLFQYCNVQADINTPYGKLGLTPAYEAIRRNHRRMLHCLIEHGARLDIQLDNPTGNGRRDWGLLHVAATSVVGGDLRIAKELVDLGVPVETHDSDDTLSETPLCLAIESNQFELANYFRTLSAKINTLSDFISRPPIKLKVPTNPLGRVIAANMHYSSHRLRYLLYPRGEYAALEQPNFIVEPVNEYSALHWSLLADELVESEDDRDEQTQDDIFALLIEKFDNEEELNLKTKGTGQTALHIAASKGNRRAVVRLLEYEADATIEDAEGKTPLELAVERLERVEKNVVEEMVDDSRAIVGLLCEYSGICNTWEGRPAPNLGTRFRSNAVMHNEVSSSKLPQSPINFTEAGRRDHIDRRIILTVARK